MIEFLFLGKSVDLGRSHRPSYGDVIKEGISVVSPASAFGSSGDAASQSCRLDLWSGSKSVHW